MMKETTEVKVSAESLAKLAKKFADQEMYEEAAHLLELACRLDPTSVALKLSLARVKELRQSRREKELKEIKERVLTERHRDDIDVGHYVGLARYYLARGQTSQALELLEIAKLKNPDRPEGYQLLAQHYFFLSDWRHALQEVKAARRLNPFDLSLAEMEARILFELKEFEQALKASVDAFLLIPHRQHPRHKASQLLIRTLCQILNLKKKDLNRLFKERLEELQLKIKRLELRREFLFDKDRRQALHEIFLKKSLEGKRRQSLLKIAAELRDLPLLRHLDDEDLFHLTRGVSLKSFNQGEKIISVGDRSFDFYIVQQGRVNVERETPFGIQVLSPLERGDLFGEQGFILRQPRAADVRAERASTLFVFPFAVMDALMEEYPSIATGLAYAFWKSLSDKIRQANNLLATFFTEDMLVEEKKRQEQIRRRSTKIQVDDRKKIGVLRSKGLTSAELSLLAAFSDEERYEGGSYVFREGEEGDKLYVVLEGKIRISKFIPGIGEEALAVLEPGDFFGEMALIDNAPRSADACAHSGPAIILAVDRRTLDEILKMDPRASYQFLHLLNRMLSQRLQEISEKIIQWKYIVGAGG